MERLTTKPQAGLIKCMDCAEYEECFGNECGHINDAIDMLRKYENTGLTVEQIMELVERDTEYFCKISIFDQESVVCKCGNGIEKDSGFNFCPYCGNRIKLEG